MVQCLLLDNRDREMNRTLPQIKRNASFDEDDLSFAEFVLIDVDDTPLPSLLPRAHSMPTHQTKPGARDRMSLHSSFAKHAWPDDPSLPHVKAAAQEKRSRDRFFRSSMVDVQSTPDLASYRRKDVKSQNHGSVRLEPLERKEECKDHTATPISVATALSQLSLAPCP